MCTEEGIEWPHGKEPKEGKEHLKVGQLMGKLFRDSGNNAITVDGYYIEKITKDVYDKKRQQNMTIKKYNIYKECEECDF